MVQTKINYPATNDNTEANDGSAHRLRTSKGETGETIYYAPVEIEHDGQLETLNITKNDVKIWHIGTEKVKVYLVPADKETAEYLLKELRNKHSRGYRSARCMVPGKRKTFIRCPDVNKCWKCPYGILAEDRRSATVSLDAHIDPRFDPGSDSVIEDDYCRNEEIGELYDVLSEADPFLVQLADMRAEGIAVKEIARLLGRPRITVYKAIKRLERIGRQYRDNN